MKKFLVLLLCLSFSPAFALPLTDESRQEVRQINTFLKAVYAQRANDSAAFALLEQALKLSPDSSYIKRLLVAQALADGKPELAKPYEDFVPADTTDPEDWTVYGAYQWKLGQVDEAEKAYERALALAPENAQVLYQYASLLSSLGSMQAASKLLELAEKYPALAADIYTTAGNIYGRSKQYQQALAYYDKALAVSPKDPAAMLGRAEVYEKTSQYFLMLHELEELEKIGYGSAATYSRMGSVFLLVKDLPKAEAYFLKAKADDNGDVPTSYFLALLAEQKGDYARAASYVRDAADYNENASKWVQVSFYLQRLNQPQESLNTLAQAYQKFPGNVEVGYFYGVALNDNAQYKKAARVLSQVLDTNSSYAEARLQYAYALDGLKKYKALEEQLEMLIGENPQNAPALNLYAYSLAERGVRLDEASAYAARALAVSPQDASFMDTMAWIYFKQNKLDQARDLLASIDGGTMAANAEIAYHYGAVLAALGQTDEAKKYLEMARSEIKAADKLYKRIK
ncbi:tetratricopeptide repeat protein [Candidatus Avelusimicrobium stercoris]|uniref:tetratricopeptide repeat protein n=1 Tax=Candidatus Avelusimicrobium stercoris TaxID=1947924 RepID=UPI003D10C4A3